MNASLRKSNSTLCTTHYLPSVVSGAKPPTKIFLKGNSGERQFHVEDAVGNSHDFEVKFRNQNETRNVKDLPDVISFC